MRSINLLSACLTVVLGLVLAISLRFFFIRHPIRCVRRLFRLLSERASRRALLLALAGTLGVGNIYGVALGIKLGGEGSAFWLFVSSFFAMAVKYSESVLSNHFASDGRGMMIPIECSFGRLGKPLAALYCISMLLLSLFMGAFIQADSLISSSSYAFSVPEILVAVVIIVAVLFVTVGGRDGIKNATEALIPLATAFYVLLSLIVIIRGFDRIPSVISRVIISAFSPTSVIFGIVPAVSSSAFTEGFARGLLSNEAGAGSSAMAHSEGKRDAADAGLCGILEIIFDTNLLCMLTALVVLLEVENPSLARSPMGMVFEAFACGVGEWALAPLLICIALFAYSTVICWYYYGCRCLSYLSLDKSKNIYAIAFYAFLFLPSILDGEGAVYLSDMLLFIMSVPTLLCLVIHRKNIAKITRKSGLLD